MNRRGFLKSIAVAAAAVTTGAAMGAVLKNPAPFAPQFEYVFPFIEQNRRLRINPDYVRAKYRCWLFKQGNQYFVQVRHVDDPPKGRVKNNYFDGYVDDHWPAKFNYIGDLPGPRTVEKLIDLKTCCE